MGHMLYMGEDGIGRTAFIGDMTEETIQSLIQDAEPFLQAVTPENPLSILHNSGQSGKYTSAARKRMLEFLTDPRIGRLAIVGAGPYTRVLLNFFIKATRRQNMRLFASEDEALSWLKAGTGAR